MCAIGSAESAGRMRARLYGRRGASGRRASCARVARTAERRGARDDDRSSERATRASSRVAYLRFGRRRGRRFVPGRLGVERLLQALDEHRLEAFSVQVALLELLAELRDGHRARLGHDARLSFSCGRATASAGGNDARAFFASPGNAPACAGSPVATRPPVTEREKKAKSDRSPQSRSRGHARRQPRPPRARDGVRVHHGARPEV